ncbi:hypothetical protein Prudu_018086 [Prunus dulcis]|uniref:Uncharacterized protein n=1 Tax=Prunus dulcis TaxID=3755 RepID=A0A4Y1RQ18_PRUDU|nr:hypothetical protein Prudu_018086 [Prunus dulcis]
MSCTKDLFTLLVTN